MTKVSQGKTQKPQVITVEREFLSSITTEELLIHLIREHLLLFTSPP